MANSAVQIAAPPPRQAPRSWNPFRLHGRPSSRTRTAPSGSLQSIGWAGYFVLRTLSGIANAMGWAFVLHTAAADRDRLFDHPADGGRLSPPDQDDGRSITWVGSIADRDHRRGRLLGDRDLEPRHLRPPRHPGPKGISFFGAILLTVSLLIAWSALYYSINFYLLLEEQSDRLLRLESQASNAQLAMLRYQLNPHFLFNTLNSISTLVLLKQTDRANAMLSRLSSFLRYTLVNESTGTGHASRRRSRR